MNECPRGSYSKLLEHRGRTPAPRERACDTLYSASWLVSTGETHLSCEVHVSSEETTAEQKELPRKGREAWREVSAGLHGAQTAAERKHRGLVQRHFHSAF